MSRKVLWGPGLLCFLLQFPLFAATTLAPYRPDQILIKPKAGSDHGPLAAFHAANGTTVIRTFAAAGGSQLLRLPANASVEGVVAKYQQSGLVEYAEPDYLVYAAATDPNDPKYVDGTLWWLNNYGQNGGTPHDDIDARDAWDVLTSASNIVVAVLDSGIRYTHEDLASNMWVNPVDGGHGFNAFTGTNDPSDDSSSGHGTLVAGVLGAVGNNGKGVCGVAWQVQMMACKCLNSSGSGSDSTVIACTEYAVTNGARVINASFDTTGFSQSVSNAIVAARDAGIIWVASAGNSSANIDVTPHYPACYGIDNIVSVAYTTRTDALGSFSDYGATNCDLAAPGDQIYSTINTSDTAYFPNIAINIAGTSFSAPCVSGACALALAKYPTENYQQIIQRLLVAVDRVPALAGKCVTGGRLNLNKLLNPPIALSVVVGANPSMFQLQLASSPNRLSVIQVSTNLADWSPVYTNTTATDGTFDFTNATPPGVDRQFFRGISSR